MSDQNHSIELEVTGSQLPLVKRLISDIELTSAVQRVRVEVESTEPLINEGALTTGVSEPEEATEAEAEPDTSDDEPEETTDEPEETTDEPEETTDDESGHLTDQLAPDADEDDDEEADVVEVTIEGDTGEPARRYLEEYDPSSWHNPPEPDEFRDVLTTPLKPGTNKWYIAGLLYRTQGKLQLGQVVSMLEDTEWEVKYKTASATLSQLKAAGMVSKTKGGYQLTQLGRDYLKSQICHTEGYHMVTADKITGTNPDDDETYTGGATA